MVFRDGECLVFVEVKTRSGERWVRPASAVNARKKSHLAKTALDYLRQARYPQVPIRFDIVEVILDHGVVGEIRHLPNAFTLSPRYRYG